MPTYEYECEKCKHHFDVFQKMSDRTVRACPKCKGKVTRLIGAGSGVIFKGSGFYQTDYKNAEARKDETCKEPKSDACKTCPAMKGNKA